MLHRRKAQTGYCARRCKLCHRISPMPLDASAAGLFPIAPTPFHPDGRIDLASVETLIAGYLAAGATGVTVLGIMGEAPKL
eukprot:gene21216-22027_t